MSFIVFVNSVEAGERDHNDEKDDNGEENDKHHHDNHLRLIGFWIRHQTYR